jgi:hypothetical protein
MRQASDDGRGAPDAGRATRFSAAARSTGGFDRLLRTLRAICRCSRRPKGRPCVPQRPGIWEISVNLAYSDVSTSSSIAMSPMPAIANVPAVDTRTAPRTLSAARRQGVTRLPIGVGVDGW